MLIKFLFMDSKWNPKNMRKWRLFVHNKFTKEALKYYKY